MLLFSPAILLAVTFLCAAQTTPGHAIAHDSYAHEGRGSLAKQQRQMTSPLSMPYEAAVSGNSIQQGNLGRNLFSLGKVEQADERQDEQPTLNAKGNKDSSVPVQSSSSVVEDWSLVCKQLCGAGLQGEICAVKCVESRFGSGTIATHSAFLHGTNRENSAERSTAGLFGEGKEAICSDLCKVGLGARTCGCSVDASHFSGKTKEQIYDIVCKSFCQHMGADIQGCHVCEKQKSSNAASHNQIIRSTKSVRKWTNTAQSTTTTTPNFTNLCATLCKTGDGGSLCNCDLSPFFLKYIATI